MARDAVLDEYILNIIKSHNIAEQMELQHHLSARGYEIPQATLSRRLKKLNIAKVSGIYKIVDFKASNVPLILNIKISELGLIVLHTNPGNANSVASYIDQKYVDAHSFDKQEPIILGTIAGDDTILLIIKSKNDLDKVLDILHDEFPYLKTVQ